MINFWLSIVVALSSSCVSPHTPALPTKPDSVVLEIITTAKGMVYPKEGDILDFRLYESGRFEYDDFPAQNPPRVTSRNVVITTQQSHISPEAVRELVAFAQQPDFLAAKDSYPAFHEHIDDIWVTTIIYTHGGQRKKISAVNLELNRPEERSKYPPSMVRLLERVHELKAEALKKA